MQPARPAKPIIVLTGEAGIVTPQRPTTPPNEYSAGGKQELMQRWPCSWFEDGVVVGSWWPEGAGGRRAGAAWAAAAADGEARRRRTTRRMGLGVAGGEDGAAMKVWRMMMMMGGITMHLSRSHVDSYSRDPADRTASVAALCPAHAQHVRRHRHTQPGNGRVEVGTHKLHRSNCKATPLSGASMDNC